MIVVGVDPSLTSTGIAVVDTDDVLTVVTHTVKSTGHRADTWARRHERIDDLAARVESHIPGRDARVIIEAPTYGQGRQGGHMDRHGLWWSVYGDALASALSVTVVSAAQRAKYATGSGNAGKDAVLLAVARRYPHAEIAGNDEADAVVLAAIGARLAGHPIDEVPKKNLEALDKLVLGR